MVLPDIRDIIFLTCILQTFGLISELQSAYKPCRALQCMYPYSVILPVFRCIVVFKLRMSFFYRIIEYLQHCLQSLCRTAVFQGRRLIDAVYLFKPRLAGGSILYGLPGFCGFFIIYIFRIAHSFTVRLSLCIRSVGFTGIIFFIPGLIYLFLRSFLLCSHSINE